MPRGLLLWESFLTFATSVSGSLGLADIWAAKQVFLIVIIVQGLNAATIVYKTGTWNPNPAMLPPQPTIVVQGQQTQPPE